MHKFFVFLLLSLFVNGVQCQTQLTLPQALELALSNQFGIAIEKLNIEASRNSNHYGEAGGLPRVLFNLNQSNGFSDVVNPASFLQGTTLRNNLNPTLSLDWVIFDGFRIRANKDRLEKLQSESEANLEVALQNSIQSVATAFYKALLEKEQLAVARQILDLSQLRYRYVRDKKEMGVATTAEVLTFQSAYLSDSVNFLTRQLAYQNALTDLKWNLNVETAVVPLGTLDLPKQSYHLDTLLQAAIASNSNLKKEYLSLELAKTNVELARADASPKISTSLNYSFERARQDISKASLPANFRASPINFANVNSGTVNFTISQTLYNGSKVQRAIENARLREKAQNLRTEQLKANIIRELTLEFNTYQARNLIYQTALSSAQVAKANLEIARERFETGLINSLDYRSIQVNYSNAEFARLNAAYQALVSLINLQRLTGGMVDRK